MTQLEENGFAVIPDVFSVEETSKIASIVAKAQTIGNNFRQTKDLYAIRKFLIAVPEVESFLFSTSYQNTVKQILGSDYFIVKSIYFDKPGASNWFVAYHQDLTISVKDKYTVEGFGPWTIKGQTYAVQPPIPILEDNITVRIHLDNTTNENGALKVLPGSHKKGEYRPETIDWNCEKEQLCEVACGGIMLMKPLLLHASSKTSNGKQRRIVHIEYSRATLPQPLEWSEYYDMS